MAKEDTIKKLTGNVQDLCLEQVMHDSMIPYAEYVILDRALPRVEDGLKPVQRRILYTMYELGITADKPYRKSARIVGDCLGKYHPHGDKSIYDAMVRLAQPFNMRNVLVDGHGNYGSVDGDTAAAMRYTEARLKPLAAELLKDIDKDTVKFSLNFDDTVKEPDMLPGRYPNLLVNGASGIAVGLATNIPPHNLGESIDACIAYIDDRNIKLKELMKIIKGPDFPTGGYIIAGEELIKAYETGKGRIFIRAKLEIENAENDKKNIVITELPYQVNKANLLQKILQLKEDKKDLLAGIYDICDESDRTGMRAVIKVKKDYDPEKIINILYKSTDLQVSYGINIVAIADGKPQQMGLVDIIYYYVNYQREIILRRTKYEIKEAKEREHILEGLVVCVKNIDEVVKIIKTSKNTSEARSRLRERFNLSEKQAQAILDMRLARLTNIEIYKLEEELKNIKALIEELQNIINSKKVQMEVLKKELLDIKRLYKDPRRSIVVGSEEDVVIDNEEERLKIVEDYAVAVNAGGDIKRIPIKNYNMSAKTLNEKSNENDIAKLLIETQSNSTIMVFTDKGNCHKVICNTLPECRWRDKGKHLYKFNKNISSDENIIFVYPYIDDLPSGSLIFFTKKGYVKKSNWSDYNLLKSSFQAIKLKDGDEVINIENDTQDTSLLFVTEKGMCLNADKNGLPIQGRVAGGVHGISLNDKDNTIFAGQVSKEGELLAVTDKGMFKKVSVKEFDVIGRYRKGVKLIDLNKVTGNKISFGCYVIFPSEIALFDKDNNIITLSTDDIKIESKSAKPKGLPNYKKGIIVEKVFNHKTCGQYITLQLKMDNI